MSNITNRVSGRVVVLALLLILAVGMMMTVSGCGTQTASTLEDIASANPDLTKKIKQEIVAPHGMTSNVSFSGDSFDITFKFNDAMDDGAQNILVKAFDSNSDTLKKSCESAIEDLQKQTKISGITCTIHIVNSSGDEIWTHGYPEKE